MYIFLYLDLYLATEQLKATQMHGISAKHAAGVSSTLCRIAKTNSIHTHIYTLAHTLHTHSLHTHTYTHTSHTYILHTYLHTHNIPTNTHTTDIHITNIHTYNASTL